MPHYFQVFLSKKTWLFTAHDLIRGSVHDAIRGSGQRWLPTMSRVDSGDWSKLHGSEAVGSRVVHSSRVESGRVGSGRVGSGRVRSGREW